MSNAQARKRREAQSEQANGGREMTTPSGQKRGRSFVGGQIPPSSRKTRATAAGSSKKGHFYRPLRKEFCRNGFRYRQIAREGDVAIYEQRWTGCTEPSVCYEVIRIRRREGFQISERLIEPYEVYPTGGAWDVDGFTFTDRNKAWDKFFGIFAGRSSKKKKGGELEVAKSYKRFVGNSKYLKKEDIPSPVNTSILWIKEEEVTAPGKGTEKRFVLYFDGLKKGLVLNTANGETLEEITGTDDTEKWSDLPVQLYTDPDVTFGQKKVGGIRIRKPGPVSVLVPKLKVRQQPY